MNKRTPLLLTLIGVILLAASIAYWILQLFQPPQRPIAAVQAAQMPDPSIDAAATLFGGQVAVASATNYQLTGIVAAGRDSVAIIVADNGPPKALRVGRELAPGVKLAEVYPRYVMLSDGGVMKRVDLAVDAKGAAPMGGVPLAAPNVVQPGVQNDAGGAAPIMPSPVGPIAPAGNVVAEPPMSAGALAPQVQGNNAGGNGGNGGDNGSQPPPANPNAAPNVGNPNNPNGNNATPGSVQMPPPTRAVGNPINPSPALQ